ncbi:hypothetical protein KY320_03595 [Candidatus Woesearchaeota archaeon]|nr:hypothetical protein [Candidatus Woesearchaeota archaeon]
MKTGSIIAFTVIIFLVIVVIVIITAPKFEAESAKTSNDEVECIDSCITKCANEPACVQECLHSDCGMKTSKSGMTSITTTI